MDRITIYDPYPIMAYSIKRILQETWPFIEVHSFCNKTSFFKFISENHTDLAIVEGLNFDDYHISEMQQYKQQLSIKKIMVFSVNEILNTSDLSKKLRFEFFLEKNVRVSYFLETVAMLMGFEVENIVENQTNLPKITLQGLSKREFQIFCMMINGMNNSEICNALNLKQSTISTLKGRMYKKLQVNNPVALFKSYSSQI